MVILSTRTKALGNMTHLHVTSVMAHAPNPVMGETAGSLGFSKLKSNDEQLVFLSIDAHPVSLNAIFRVALKQPFCAIQV